MRRGAEATPAIDITVEAGDWPEETRLRSIAHHAIAAAGEALNSAGAGDSPFRKKAPHSPYPGKGGESGGGRHLSPLPDPPPRGGRELSIVFTDDAGIRRLNAAFRGKDAATNVLSFPQRSGPLLGDIVLAAETVRREAALAGKPPEAHMAHLIIHGFLHLLGYDHESDAEAAAMEALEKAALAEIGIADPYAAAQGI